MSDESVQVENTKAMLGERERTQRPAKEVERRPATPERAQPSWRRWLLSLDVDDLVTLYGDPSGVGAWNDALRAEVLELIRSKGGDQAVRRAIGLHLDRPAERGDVHGEGSDGSGAIAQRRSWRGTAVAEPGRQRALERVGRAWVEAALAWTLRQQEGGGAPRPWDLTAPLTERWPELAPPPLAAGAPGIDIELAGPRRAASPSGLLRQHDEAFRSLLEAAQGRATTLYGRVERTDGSVEWIYACEAAGLGLDALEVALGEVSSPGVGVGRLRRLGVLLWPDLAYHHPTTGAVLVGPSPPDAPPDPLRPGPLRWELAMTTPSVTWRASIGPEAVLGVTGVINASRVLEILGRLSNAGFVPAADPAARLAVPAPVVRRQAWGPVTVHWTQRPGDDKACARLEGPPGEVLVVRAKLLEQADEDLIRAASVTAPDGPVPASLP